MVLDRGGTEGGDGGSDSGGSSNGGSTGGDSAGSDTDPRNDRGITEGGSTGGSSGSGGSSGGGVGAGPTTGGGDVDTGVDVGSGIDRDTDSGDGGGGGRDVSGPPGGGITSGDGDATTEPDDTEPSQDARDQLEASDPGSGSRDGARPRGPTTSDTNTMDTGRGDRAPETVARDVAEERASGTPESGLEDDPSSDRYQEAQQLEQLAIQQNDQIQDESDVIIVPDATGDLQMRLSRRRREEDIEADLQAQLEAARDEALASFEAEDRDGGFTSGDGSTATTAEDAFSDYVRQQITEDDIAFGSDNGEATMGLDEDFQADIARQRAAAQSDEFGPEDFETTPTEDGGVRATLSEDAVREEVAGGLTGVDAEDVVLEETDDGYQLDREATAERALGADEQSEPGVAAEVVSDAATAVRDSLGIPGLGTGLTLTAESLRREQGIAVPDPFSDDAASLPGQQDVDAAQQRLEPAAQEIDEYIQRAGGAVGDATDRVSEPGGNVEAAQAAPFGFGGPVLAATSETGAESIERGVTGGLEALNPARAGQDALQVSEYTIRGLDAATGEEGAQAVQTGGEAAYTLGELAVEEGAPAAIETAREDPAAVGAVSVGGGLVLGAGAVGGTAAVRAPRAAGRVLSDAPDVTQHAASGTVESAQRAGRRVARSDRRPRVSLTEDPDAGLVQVETPDLPSLRSMDVDFDTPSLSGAREAVGQRALGTAADIELGVQRGRRAISESDFLGDTGGGRVQPLDWEAPSTGAARSAVRQRALGAAVDTDLALQRAGGRVRGALDVDTPSLGDLPDRPSVGDAADWARMRGLGLAVDADLFLQRTRRRASNALEGPDIDIDSPFISDTGTDRVAPWTTETPDLGAARDAASDRLTGLAIDGDLALDRLRPSLSRPSRPSFDLDVDSAFLSDTGTERVAPWGAETPDVGDVRQGVTDRFPSRPSFSGWGAGDDVNLGDLTLRIDLSGRQADDADQVVDVEDLQPPGAAEGVPDYQDLEVEGYQPGTDIPETRRVGENTLTQESQIDIGGGQMARIRGQQAEGMGTDTMQRLDELDDADTDLFDTSGFGVDAGAGSTAAAGATSRLTAAQESSFDVDETLGVGELQAGEVAGVGEDAGLGEMVDVTGAGLSESVGVGDMTTTVTTETFDIPTTTTPGMDIPGNTYSTPNPKIPPLPTPETDRDSDWSGFGVDTDEEIFGSGIMSGEEALESAFDDDFFGADSR